MSDFIIITALIIGFVFVLILAFYYKVLYKKTIKENEFLKKSLREAEIILKKYQVQLQRSMGNIDLLTEELNKTKNALKTARGKNSQLKAENNRLRREIKELKNKIEALI